eukprot:3940732-Rhodomonas_salina.1
MSVTERAYGATSSLGCLQPAEGAADMLRGRCASIYADDAAAYGSDASIYADDAAVYGSHSSIHAGTAAV